MPDRKEEVLPQNLGGSITEGPSSDSYIARGLAVIVQGIEGTNGKISDLKPTVVDVIPAEGTSQLSGKAYEPKLISTGRKGSSIDTRTRSRLQSATGSLGLSVLDTPLSSAGNKIVEYRSRALADRKV